MATKKERVKKLHIRGYNLYAIPMRDLDSPSKQNWIGPFLALDDQMALMSFAEMARSEPSLQRKYLYKIGFYNAELGVITPLSHTLVKAIKIKKEVKDEKEVSH